MSDVVFLSRRQMRCIARFFPRSRGKPRVNDRRVVSGIVYVIRNGLMWKDAPRGYGPHKTLYNRFVRWSRAGAADMITPLAFGDFAPRCLSWRLNDPNETGLLSHVCVSSRDTSRGWHLPCFRRSQQHADDPVAC